MLVSLSIKRMWEIEVGIPRIEKILVISTNEGIRVAILNDAKEEMDVKHFIKLVYGIRGRLDRVIEDLTQAMREAGAIMLE